METERLIIDRLTPDDRHDYFTNISHDCEVLKTFVCRYAEKEEDVDISNYVNSQGMFAIRLKQTGQMIGIILYFDEKPDSCEVGYGIGSRYWNRGYVTEALRCFLDYLFEERKMKIVYASFFPENKASEAVMKKCGMSYDHYSAREMTYLGIERDLIYYSITKGNVPAI
jgi:ribosomal-protein-alanine N-acetyltransferase